MTAPSPSSRASGLPRSGIRAVTELAQRTPGTIRLDIGDPDFPTPPHIVEAVARAAADGFTHYGPAAGLPSLRAAIAGAVARRGDRSCAPEQVAVTVGAAGGIFCSLLALADPGDEVLLPDPGWASLVPMALAAGLRPVFYPLERSLGFAPDVDALAALIGPRTRALILNTPGNPTGAVLSRRVVAEIAALAARRGVWIVADECYERLVLDGEHVSVASVSPAPETVVTVASFSKTYAMTGWRVGYVVAEPAVIELVARVQEAALSCPPTPAQKGAEAALAGPQDLVEEMRAAYRRRRDLAQAALEGRGVPFVPPAGAFYLLADVSAAGGTAEAFAASLLAEGGVAVVAGSAFGARGEGFVRISLAAPESALAAGLEVLADALGAAATGAAPAPAAAEARP